MPIFLECLLIHNEVALPSGQFVVFSYTMKKCKVGKMPMSLGFSAHYRRK